MKTLESVKRIFLNVAAFVPIVFFKIWASLGVDTASMLTAACVLFIYCILVITIKWKLDRPSYFDLAVGGYFLLMVASLLLWPEAVGRLLTHYPVTGIYLCLFAAAFLPPVFGFAPFTLHYARKQAPPDFWDNRIFLKLNRIMAFTWAAVLGICVLLSLYPSLITRVIVPHTLIFGVGFPFNKCFPDYYLKRIGLPARSELRASVENPAASKAPALSDSWRTPAPDEKEQRVLKNTHHKETTMKVIALNSSPRGEGISKTGMLLDALVKGMRETGAEVEIIPLRHKKINPCVGCYTCWTKSPGICAHKDDMTNEIFPKWLEADIAVYATPLYHYTVNASMKTFIERTLPASEPFLLRRGGRTSHPRRGNIRKSLVLSVAGFPEIQVFGELSRYVNFLFRDGLLAEIYRPGAEMLTLPEFAEARKEILEAATRAGSEIVQSGKVAPATIETITQPIGMDLDSFATMANLFWKTCIQEGVTPGEFHRNNLIPRPDSIVTFMMMMRRGFNPDSAAQTKAVLQFVFSGEIEETCHFEIANGKIDAKQGSSANPDLTIESPFETWMDAITGKADGQQLFMQKKYKASGDLSLLMRMKELFGKV